MYEYANNNNNNLDLISNLTKIDISNQNIKGILDLNKFVNLEELDCSNNEIVEIINIPPKLKYLNCSNNQLTSLFYTNSYKDKGYLKYLTGLDCSNNKIKSLFLSNNLIELNYDSNPIEKLFYNCNIKIDKYPSKLKYLKFAGMFNQPINNLPDSVIHLDFHGSMYNKTMDYENILDMFTYLELPDCFNNSLDNLPNSIKEIKFGNSFKLISLNKSKNSSVTSYKIGLPAVSDLPTSRTKSCACNFLSIMSQPTPRISSISVLVIGCLYAIIANVSSADCDN